MYKLFSILSFIFSAGCCVAQVESNHRQPLLEYWDWKDEFDDNFHKCICDEMEKQRAIIEKYFKEQNRPKNICLARFAFRVRSGSVEKLVPLKKIKSLKDIGFSEKGVFARHMFISGSGLPDFEYPKISVVGKTREKKEVSVKAKIRFIEEKNGETYKSSHKIEGCLENNFLIHPPLSFKDRLSVIKRINRLYEDRSDVEICGIIMARMARQYLRNVISQNKLSYIKWCDEAMKPGPFHIIGEGVSVPKKHASSSASSSSNDDLFDKQKCKRESEHVFFSQNEDSEQKMLWYLNAITDCARGNTLLNGLTIRLKEAVERLPHFRNLRVEEFAGRVSERFEQFSDSDDVNFSQIFDDVQGLAGLARKAQMHQSGSLGDDLSKLLDSIQDGCNKFQVSLDKNVKYVQSDIEKVLEEYVQLSDSSILSPCSFLTEISSIREGLCDLEGYLLEEKRKNSFKSFGLEKLIKRTSKFESILDSLSTELSSKKNSRENIVTLMNDINDLEKESRHDIKEKLLVDFQKAVNECLNTEKKDNSPRNITEIILYIHNSYDGCYSCAPDIAQELNRKGGFVEYFTELVKGMNPSNGAEKSFTPTFTIKVSCYEKRDGTKSEKWVWCEECKSSSVQKKNIKPLYFQYYVNGSRNVGGSRISFPDDDNSGEGTDG